MPQVLLILPGDDGEMGSKPDEVAYESPSLTAARLNTELSGMAEKPAKKAKSAGNSRPPKPAPRPKYQQSVSESSSPSDMSDGSFVPSSSSPSQSPHSVGYDDYIPSSSQPFEEEAFSTRHVADLQNREQLEAQVAEHVDQHGASLLAEPLLAAVGGDGVAPGYMSPVAGAPPLSAAPIQLGAWMIPTETARWFSMETISPCERAALPLWLTPEPNTETDRAYRASRNVIVVSFRRTPQVYLCFTAARRVLPVDAGRAYQLWAFLSRHGIINFGLEPPLVDEITAQHINPGSLGPLSRPPAGAVIQAIPTEAPEHPASPAAEEGTQAETHEVPEDAAEDSATSHSEDTDAVLGLSDAFVSPATARVLAMPKEAAFQALTSRRALTSGEQRKRHQRPGRPSNADRATLPHRLLNERQEAAVSSSACCVSCGEAILPRKRWFLSSEQPGVYCCEDCYLAGNVQRGDQWVPFSSNDSHRLTVGEREAEMTITQLDPVQSRDRATATVSGVGFSRSETAAMLSSGESWVDMSASVGRRRSVLDVAAAFARLPYLDNLVEQLPPAQREKILADAMETLAPGSEDTVPMWAVNPSLSLALRLLSSSTIRPEPAPVPAYASTGATSPLWDRFNRCVASS